MKFVDDVLIVHQKPSYYGTNIVKCKDSVENMVRDGLKMKYGG